MAWRKKNMHYAEISRGINLQLDDSNNEGGHSKFERRVTPSLLDDPLIINWMIACQYISFNDHDKILLPAPGSIVSSRTVFVKRLIS